MSIPVDAIVPSSMTSGQKLPKEEQYRYPITAPGLFKRKRTLNAIRHILETRTQNVASLTGPGRNIREKNSIAAL